MKEMVNHPSHYNAVGKKECIIEMQEQFGTEAVIHFCMLSAYKYKYRAGLKDNKRQDLEKANWYTDYAKKLMMEAEKK